MIEDKIQKLTEAINRLAAAYEGANWEEAPVEEEAPAEEEAPVEESLPIPTTDAIKAVCKEFLAANMGAELSSIFAEFGATKLGQIERSDHPKLFAQLQAKAPK